jgi:glycerate-2-kinase
VNDFPLQQNLIAILESGIQAVRPSDIFPAIFSANRYDELKGWLNSPQRYLLGIGKAAVSSISTILKIAQCEDYRVVAPSGVSPADLDPTKLLFGSHPLPDDRSFAAAILVTQWLDRLPDGQLLVVLSGGASAVFAMPLPGISPSSKTELNRLLIRSGASIHEMNTVRKHCSLVKGGRLGQRALRFNPVVLAISDVVGDDLQAIGSGLFYGDRTTYIASLEVLKRYGIWDQAPADVRQSLERGAAGLIEETPRPENLRIPHYIVASNQLARMAAAQKAAALGYSPEIHPELLYSRVEDAAELIAGKIKDSKPGTAWIAGGEITVKVGGNGIGGRNQHLTLLITPLISGSKALFAAAGTDGVDGNSTAAGAWTDGNTAKRASQLNLNYRHNVAEYDSNRFFDQLGQTIVTGPTGTNVMDLYVALIPH